MFSFVDMFVYILKRLLQVTLDKLKEMVVCKRNECFESHLVGLAVGVLSEQTGFLQLVGELVHALLVLLCPVLQHFAHTGNKQNNV